MFGIVERCTDSTFVIPVTARPFGILSPATAPDPEAETCDPVRRPRDPRAHRAPGRAADEPVGALDTPRSRAVDDARDRPHPGRARHGRAGARLEPLPARTGRAPPRQRLPRLPRAAVQGRAVGRVPLAADGDGGA